MATALHSARTRFFDKCGKPLCGGTVYTYQVGTTTAKPTYTDVSKTATNTNPVILDSIGSAAIFLDGAYRVRVLDRNDVLVEDIQFIESWISATEQDKIYENIAGNKSAINAHINKSDNPHQVTKAQVGLSNVDNTADIDKPVSKATNAALFLKSDKSDTYNKTEVDTKVSAVSGGYIGAFATLIELQAKTGMTTGQVAKVMNDSDTAKNGDYHYDGSSWVKGYDALTDAKAYADANPMFKKVQLKDGDDLNNIVKTGIYYNSADLTDAQLKNIPETYAGNAVLGTLIVNSIYETKAAGVHQTFYPHTGNHFYSRSTNTSGTFGEWGKSISGSDFSQVLNKTQVQMITLEQAKTLDVLTMSAGLYSWTDFPEGRAIANMPPVTYPFGLLEIKNTASAQSGGYKQATFYPYGRHKEFWINKNFETGWTGWMRYVDADTLKAEIVAVSNKYIPTLVMPPKIYALAGIESHIYPEHLVIDDFTLYNHKVSAYRGQHKNRGFVWTPTIMDSAGDYGVTWSLFDKQTAGELATASTKITLVDKNKDSGVTKKVMVIGDSYINGGVITQQILDCAAKDVTKVQLIGTRGTAPNLHEGRSGWKISDYTSNRSDNPFWINGKVDYLQFLANNSLATPDIIIIELGVNDSFAQTTDTEVVTMTQTAFSNLDTLISSFKAANANIKIGLCLPPKYADQDAFGNDYGTQYDAWRCSRNIAVYNRKLIARYKDSETQNIYVVASGFNVDTLNNYPTIQEPINSHNSTLIDVQNNSVHPYPKGYQQIGDMMFVFIKAI